MIDQANITVSSGKGGDGSISGRHEKYVPMGGPDGGDGGRGGSLILKADRNINTLVEFRYRRIFRAGDGGYGLGALKHGANGKDVTIPVPVGTQIFLADADGNAKELIVDLDSHAQTIVVARGGAGGRGNAAFASSTNQFPLLAEAGAEGETLSLRIELKLLADVGLVGLPNAGKSSLLAAVSSARPKVASYPFTTLEPVLGVVAHLGIEFLMVDNPGLIEGAHEGIGLGHEFLRHIERTRVLVLVVDISSEDPERDGRQVVHEMVMFDERLTKKPMIVALNKVDVPGAEARVGELTARFEADGMAVVAISAAARTGLKGLLDLVVESLGRLEGSLSEKPNLAERLAGRRSAAVQRRPVMAESQDEVPIIRPRPIDRKSGVTIVDGVFVVEAPTAARMAVMVDPDSWPAKQQFYGHLRKMGIVQKLEELGIKTGDTVKLGEMEWEWL